MFKEIFFFYMAKDWQLVVGKLSIIVGGGIGFRIIRLGVIEITSGSISANTFEVIVAWFIFLRVPGVSSI